MLFCVWNTYFKYIYWKYCPFPCMKITLSKLQYREATLEVQGWGLKWISHRHRIKYVFLSAETTINTMNWHSAGILLARWGGKEDGQRVRKKERKDVSIQGGCLEEEIWTHKQVRMAMIKHAKVNKSRTINGSSIFQTLEPWQLPSNWPIHLADYQTSNPIIIQGFTVKRNWCTNPILPSDWLKHFAVVFWRGYFGCVSLSFYGQTLVSSDGNLSLFPRETSI